MSWDHLVVSILAAFGAVTLLLSQLHDVLVKLLEVLEAWQRVKARLRRPDPGGRRRPRSDRRRPASPEANAAPVISRDGQ